MMPALVIFDFDGVIADSEEIANRLLAQSISEIGHPTTTEESIRHFMGKRWADCLVAIEERIGAPLPAGFEQRHRARSRHTMRSEVRAVPGIQKLLDDLGRREKCIASSSSMEWLDEMTRRFGIDHHFDDRLFSATMVSRGKPAPDIFLHAAEQMAAAPAACVVVEDSLSGVLGARAAGMRVVGFVGGSHIRDGHARRLLEAGAHEIVESHADLGAALIGIDR
jgi:HAD superfamily hydrolase (TIGR01509 family)